MAERALARLALLLLGGRRIEELGFFLGQQLEDCLSPRIVGFARGFIAELRQREALAARALEFLILTAARTGEVIGARWGEINLPDSVGPATRRSRKH